MDGEVCAVFRQGTLSTPYIFELTGAAPGEHEFTFLSDNSYPGMPKAAICYSSAATDETQIKLERDTWRMQHVYQTAEFYRQRSGISEGGEKGGEK